MRILRILFAPAVLVGTFGIIAPSPSSAASSYEVPSPLVTGPIPATAQPGDLSHNYPFFATDQNLRAYGYLEQEFFIEGTATRFTTPAGQTGDIIDGGHPYKTRIVVRRPASAKRFNGTAIVEWNNVTNTFDYEVVWTRSFVHMMRAGYVWVGVSAQRNGVHTDLGLRAWNPNRYGTLDLTAGGTVTDDSLSYDVFSQAAKAITAPRGVSPVGNFAVRTIIATGQSQSAGRLTTYANSVHPIAPAYDAIAIIDSISPAQIRPDITTKVFKSSSEWDILNSQAANRQPDSDRFVSWEVAGASHSDRHNFLINNPVRLRDTGRSGLLAGPTAPCVSPARSNMPYELVHNAMFDHIVRWIRHGSQPPTGPQMEITDLSTRPFGANRDAFQIIRGGIRLAAVDVPTERNTGWNLGLITATNSSCAQGGTWIPFDDLTLKTLYPNHHAYVDAVRRVTRQNLRDGYLVTADAEATIRAAEQSRIGR